MGEKLGYERGALPVTEDLAERVVRLPCFFELTETEQREVVDAVFGFFARP
jgi:dTDP-4-amino-4,6-dideoxygalactose transaminase